MTQFVWADDDRLNDILSLWKQGFPEDTEEDIRTFWRTMQGEARCLLLLEEDEARSMAFLIPTRLVRNGTHSVWYVYAVATAKAHRGRGLFPQLLQEILRRAEEEGVYGLFLHPGTESLFGYYARLGFVPTFSVKKFQCKAKELHRWQSALTWRNVTANYAVCRHYWLALCGVPYVAWSECATAYAVGLLENGGMAVSSKGAVMYRQSNGTLTVTELLCRPQDRDEVLASLARHFTCQKMTVTMPPSEATAGQPYGMFYSLSKEMTADGGWYMGFSLE